MVIAVAQLLRTIALCASLAAAASVTAAPRLVYTGQGSKTVGICTINADGSNNACVANGYRGTPTIGGDLFLVNNRNDNPSENRAVYRIGPDGSNVRLVSWGQFDAGPSSVAASPDGTRIVTESVLGNGPFSAPQIVVSAADGSGRIVLTNYEAVTPTSPSFSPDGSTIAFQECISGAITEYGNICTIPATGGTARVIARRGAEPQWSRSGRIAFRDVDTNHIILVNGDGSGRFDTGIIGYQPSLSADARSLAYVSFEPDGWHHLIVSGADGSGAHEVAIGHHPTWYPGTVQPSAPPPGVTVGFPTAGEIVGGQPVTFTWTAAGNIAAQSLALASYEPTLLHGSPNETYDPNFISFGFTIVANLPPDVRSFTWTPPASLQWTLRLVRVGVVDTEGQVAIATAGPVTTRPGPGAPPYVRVAYPSEPGIRMQGGSNAGFTSSQILDPDGIARSEWRLSLDGGATFPILLGTVTGDGTSIGFAVPNTATTRARVKLTAWDTLGNSASDVSDNDFEIFATQTAPALSYVSLSPSSVTAGAVSQGTLSLTTLAPASGASVALSSSNPAVVSVPASVVVPGGKTIGTFTASTKAVSTTTAVTISGSYGGLTRTTTLTINPSSGGTTTTPPPTATTDTVSVTRAEFDSVKRQLRVEAKSSSASATLNAYVYSSGALIGSLANLGGGRYAGTLGWSTNPQRITIKSSLGGSATASITVK